MAASSVTAVKDALVARISASPDLAGVDVQWPPPPAEPASDERVYIGQADQIQTVWAGLGKQTRTETYRLAVFVEHAESGDDLRGSELRAFQIAAAVDGVIVADPSLGLTADPANDVRDLTALPGVASQSTEALPDGVMANVTMTVTVQARIRST